MEEGEISVDNADGDSNTSDSSETWSAHAVAQNQNKISPHQKTPKLAPIKLSIEPKPDPCISPDYPGKRKRIQHDYRRLSNSGYVEDSVTKRFSSTSDSEVSTSPTPPKMKGKGESLLNGSSGKQNNGTFTFKVKYYVKLLGFQSQEYVVILSRV